MAYLFQRVTNTLSQQDTHDFEQQVEEWMTNNSIGFIDKPVLVRNVITIQFAPTALSSKTTRLDVVEKDYYLNDDDAVMFKLMWGEHYEATIQPNFFE